MSSAGGTAHAWCCVRHLITGRHHAVCLVVGSHGVGAFQVDWLFGLWCLVDVLCLLKIRNYAFIGSKLIFQGINLLLNHQFLILEFQIVILWGLRCRRFRLLYWLRGLLVVVRSTFHDIIDLLRGNIWATFHYVAYLLLSELLWWAFRRCIWLIELCHHLLLKSFLFCKYLAQSRGFKLKVGSLWLILTIFWRDYRVHSFHGWWLWGFSVRSAFPGTSHSDIVERWRNFILMRCDILQDSLTRVLKCISLPTTSSLATRLIPISLLTLTSANLLVTLLLQARADRKPVTSLMFVSDASCSYRHLAQIFRWIK